MIFFLHDIIRNIYQAIEIIFLIMNFFANVYRKLKKINFDIIAGPKQVVKIFTKVFIQENPRAEIQKL